MIKLRIEGKVYAIVHESGAFVSAGDVLIRNNGARVRVLDRLWISEAGYGQRALVQVIEQPDAEAYLYGQRVGDEVIFRADLYGCSSVEIGEES